MVSSPCSLPGTGMDPSDGRSTCRDGRHELHASLGHGEFRLLAGSVGIDVSLMLLLKIIGTDWSVDHLEEFSFRAIAFVRVVLQC